VDFGCIKYKCVHAHGTPLTHWEQYSRNMRQNGVLTDDPVHPSPAPFWARASAERGSGARIDSSSGFLVVPMCCKG